MTITYRELAWSQEWNPPPLTQMLAADNKTQLGRSFLRHLNIVVKLVRLYGFDHVRTAEQFNKTWTELQSALAENGKGLVLGASGARLFLDGALLEAGPAERTFAQVLSGAGIASIQFLPQVTREDLACLVGALPMKGKATASPSSENLQEALAGAAGIRVNEVRFVEERPGVAGEPGGVSPGLQPQLPATADSTQSREWLNDPQKLLQFIVASFVSHGAPARGGDGGGTATIVRSDGSEVPADSSEIPAASEDSGAAHDLVDAELVHVVRLLSRLGQTGAAPLDGTSPLPGEMTTLSGRTKELLEQALAGLAAQAPAGQPKEVMLVRLAEHLATQSALDRYHRGEIAVGAIPAMLARMSAEIESLREAVGVRNEATTQTGLRTETQLEALDRQFWAGVPDRNKQQILSSPDAWCIPARNVRQYVEELRSRGDISGAAAILETYASCLSLEDPDARRRTAAGLAELADLYATVDPAALTNAIRLAGAQLGLERDPELQKLNSAAFVRLSQEAGKYQRYPALLQTLNSLDTIENQRPTSTQSIAPQLDLGKRLPEFIEEAFRTAPSPPEGLLALLAAMPRSASDCLVTRFNRAALRSDRERLVEIAGQIGPEGVVHLRETLQAAPPREAAEVVGLLSRLEASAVAKRLAERLHDWPRPSQDRALRVLAASGTPQRGEVLVEVFDYFDPMLRPLVIDEISMTESPSGPALLMRLASGQLPAGSTPFLQVKAIEAVGRQGNRSAAQFLRDMVDSRKLWRWAHAAELRFTALQALLAIAPDAAEILLPRSGFTREDLTIGAAGSRPDAPWIRQRRYPRVRLANPMPAIAASDRESIALQIRGLSLGGGFATTERHLVPGTLVSLRLGSSLQPIKAKAFMRDTRGQATKFEFVDMDLDERARLRRLLRESAVAAPSPAPAA